MLVTTLRNENGSEKLATEAIAHILYIIGDEKPEAIFVLPGEHEFPDYGEGYSYVRRDKETKLLNKFTCTDYEISQPTEELKQELPELYEELKCELVRIRKTYFTKEVLPESEQDPEFEKKQWINSVAIITYCNSERLPKQLSINTNKYDHEFETYFDNWSIEGTKYTRKERVMPDEDPQLFEQITQEAEGTYISEIWKVHFQIAG
ncbi:MAG: hypothetical protein C6Y22_30630 [Hapalosiphonaceae cyanobacterium JJU2]|nr:MAG: hypothetical protein C6Y22_30630 [Hapalosiphonaceae cyanobacterium JJU2]